MTSLGRHSPQPRGSSEPAPSGATEGPSPSPSPSPEPGHHATSASGPNQIAADDDSPSIIVRLDNGRSAPGAPELIWSSRVYRQGLFSSAMTLCLSIMGGAVFPVPWAFSITGAGAGTFICLTVAAANAFTSDLLIKQCHRTGTRNYEELALATGGAPWLVVTRVSTLVLLLGSMISPVRQSAEAAVFAAQGVLGPGGVPGWMLYKDGAGFVFMLLFVAVIVFPLCLVKELKSLEHAGVAGFLMMVFLVGAVALEALVAGMPALASGDFSASGFSSTDNLAQAVSVLSYAFFIQPLMLPLLNEMPGPPAVQANILSWAMRFAVMGFALGVYLLVGFFGASWYGHQTRGNILQNKLLGGGLGQAALNLLMAVYICLSVPPEVFCTRHILNNWVPGAEEGPGMIRTASISSGILGLLLAVNVFWRGGSEKVLAVTGATGVLMTAYVCPVVNHFLLYFGWAKCQREASATQISEALKLQSASQSADVLLRSQRLLTSGTVTEPLLDLAGRIQPQQHKEGGSIAYARDFSEFHGLFPRLMYMILDFFLPVIIVVVGFLCSGVTLYMAFRP